MEWKTIENPLFKFEENDNFAKFHFDFVTKEPPEELYHFTTRASFISILETQTLFATERSYLNDSKEYEWGFENLIRYIESISTYPQEFINHLVLSIKDKSDDNSRLFILSLSANPDILSQWRAYAEDGQGYAIGLNGSVLRERSGFGEYVLNKFDISKLPKDKVYSYHLLEVIYDEDKQTQLFQAFIKSAFEYWKKIIDFNRQDTSKLFELIVRHRIKEILSSIKNPGFKEEKEWRITTSIHKSSSKMRFRNGAFGLTPYVILDLSPNSMLQSTKLPLESIWIGPKALENRNILGLKMFCENNSLSTNYNFSKINYR